ncbi:hypothetical protein RND71_020676 [Anisodus tanguticus]|uniref:Disease resistance R13L4/SHOC-2-like LRR domain-containing protein n=1 Tax=Anisodus tanguticus TaxID=243964 RepID=A0AAE1V7K7_9SOLA|nr:hypothetical protein RND71_020676 [Anisodus tanguticus]
MSRLTTLDLSFNIFNGTIPGAVGQLSELKHLQLRGNNFEGSIPWEIGNLSNLETLDISEMEIFELATIPEELGKLKDLKELRIIQLKLIGHIPETFSSLSSIEYMDLSINSLNGSLPHSKLSLSKDSQKKTQEIDDWKFIPFRSTNLRESEILLNLTEENLIGSGGSGNVYRIAVRENRSHVAVKRISNDKNLTTIWKNSFLQNFRH